MEVVLLVIGVLLWFPFGSFFVKTKAFGIGWLVDTMRKKFSKDKKEFWGDMGDSTENIRTNRIVSAVIWPIIFGFTCFIFVIEIFRLFHFILIKIPKRYMNADLG